MSATVISAELFDKLRSSVIDRLTVHRQATEIIDREEERLVVRQFISDALDEHAQTSIVSTAEAINPNDEEEVSQQIFDSILGLGRLQRLLEDPSIENINANGCDVVVVRYADGRREQVAPIADSDAELIELVRTAAARLGGSERRFDMGSPSVDLQLPDGSRLFAVMAVSDRPSLSIRRHRHSSVSLDNLIHEGTINLPMRHFFTSIVLARKNVIVSGGTAAGKTTFLRALISEIPEWERLVVVEDSRELDLKRNGRHIDVTSLETRQANVEGEGEVTLSTLVRMALRMSPDRTIVGEVRGQEILPMLNAMSQGNDGSLSTIHANSSQATFTKIATYAIQSAERYPIEATNLLVSTALNFVVFISQDPASGRRFVSSVREVVGVDETFVTSNEIIRCDDYGVVLPGSRLSAANERNLMAAGFDPSYFYDIEQWT